MSRNPRVTSMPTRAVLPSMMALVATVVAWTTAATSRPPAPHSSRPRSSALMKPRAGSSGVVRTLTTRTWPVSASTSAASVKVPPMSIPTRQVVMGSGTPREGLGLAPLGVVDHPGPCEHDLRALVHGHVDHAAIEIDRGRAAAHALLEGLDHAARVLHLGGIGREDPVENGDLVGMDAARPFTAELARALGGLLEDGEIAEARDAAHQPRGLDADDLAYGDEMRHGIHELDAVRRWLHPQLEAVI